MGQSRFNQSLSVRRRRRSGFTLIEVSVSMFILLMGALTVFAMTTLSSRLNKQTEAKALGLAIARKQLENLITTSQPNRKLVQTIPFEIPEEIVNQIAGGEATGFSGNYSIEAVDGSPNLERITVTVFWNNISADGALTPSTVTLTKLVASVDDLNGTSYNGQTDIDDDQYFFTPPPPPPPTSGGGGGSTDTGGSTGGTDGGTTGGTDGGTTGGTDGGTTGGTDGGTTGGTTGGTDGGSGGATGGGGSTGGTDSGGSTGTSAGGTTGGGFPGLSGNYGSKW